MLKAISTYLYRHRESRFVKKALAIFLVGSRKLFKILPLKASFFWITATRLFDRRISYFLASDFMPIALKRINSLENYNFASLLTAKLPLQAAGTLVRLGAVQQVKEWLSDCDPLLYTNEHFFTLALDFFDRGEFEQAKEVVARCMDLTPRTPELLRFKGLMALMTGQESLAASSLKAYADLAAAGWCPHQNIAARYPDSYLSLSSDKQAGVEGLFFDAYNFMGQYVTRVGRGELATTFYGKALEMQVHLKQQRPLLSRELVNWLEKEGLRFEDLHLLPWEWTTQIGHLGMLELLFRMRDLGWWSGPALILAAPPKIANKTLLSLFQDKARILIGGVNLSESLAQELFSLQRYRGINFNAWKFASGEVVPWQQAGARLMPQWEAEGRSYPLREAFDAQFSGSALDGQAAQFKSEWGMKPGDWYVCLHVRDSEFYGELQGFGQSIRNCELSLYEDAIRYITDQGGWVIKMGGVNSSKLPALPRVINYAHSKAKSEFMDLHLIRHTRFFIGTTSGLTNIAISFNRPCALVNCVTNDAQLWSSQVRFALKPVLTENAKLLSQLEITSTPWRWRVFNAEVVRRHKAQIRANSADEILETIKEVNSLATGEKSAYLNNFPEAAKLLQRWRTCLAFPEFYGASQPSIYYLKKYEQTFLNIY